MTFVSGCLRGSSIAVLLVAGLARDFEPAFREADRVRVHGTRSGLVPT